MMNKITRSLMGILNKIKSYLRINEIFLYIKIVYLAASLHQSIIILKILFKMF